MWSSYPASTILRVLFVLHSLAPRLRLFRLSPFILLSPLRILHHARTFLVGRCPGSGTGSGATEAALKQGLPLVASPPPSTRRPLPLIPLMDALLAQLISAGMGVGLIGIFPLLRVVNTSLRLNLALAVRT